ncbi:Ig-like domain-containing protein [Candidatus Marinimicrobia bacterium]|nr:Ig-like domain-containing protein [Candidatus Neomarinimicrobiota bacterium]
MSRILLIIAIIILNNCASVRNPEGGPVDKIPPTLVSTNPQTLTSITPKQKVTIRFSEYLKESSIKNSIQVYPMNGEKIKYEFRGDKIDVMLPKNLNNEMTYIIMFDTGLLDEHSIPIKHDISIPFTMSSEFDTSKIEGHVYGDFDNSTILLWRGNLDRATMLDTNPDYIANTNDDNKFTFNYLPEEKFSVLAVQQYGSNIDYAKGQYAFYHETTLSTKDKNLDKINFFIHKASDVEVLEKDSLAVVAENSEETKRVAKVSGTVTGKFLHPIKILLQNDTHSYVDTVALDGSYTINNIVGGKYQLLVFEDRNNDNKLDAGSFENTIQAEEFNVYSESLSCRENWELELPIWNYEKENIE